MLVRRMGEMEVRIAGRFLQESALKTPLSANQFARALNIWMLREGSNTPMNGRVLPYDPRSRDWERHVWLETSGYLLRWYGESDRYSMRVALALVLGAELGDDEQTGKHAAPMLQNESGVASEL